MDVDAIIPRREVSNQHVVDRKEAEEAQPMSYEALEEVLLDTLRRLSAANEPDLLDVQAQQQLMQQLKTVHQNLERFEEGLSENIDGAVATLSGSEADGYVEFKQLRRRQAELVLLRGMLRRHRHTQI
jgi:hypothetical protein